MRGLAEPRRHSASCARSALMPGRGGERGAGLAAMSLTSGAAGRYATALFELAQEADELDLVEGDLAQLAEALADRPELGDLIRNPIYSRDEQGRAVGAVVARTEVSRLVQHGIRPMTAKRRVFA